MPNCCGDLLRERESAMRVGERRTTRDGERTAEFSISERLLELGSASKLLAFTPMSLLLLSSFERDDGGEPWRPLELIEICLRLAAFRTGWQRCIR